MKRHWVVLWSLWAARLVPQPAREVRVAGGLVRGRLAPDGSHAQYLAVPYAAVTPDRRFKAAGPARAWRGVLEAVQEHVRCPQRKGGWLLMGQEDCLALNVYTPPAATRASRLPVMAFIHGGGFYDGSASRHLYGARYLVRHGVVLVTINYRLNIQGFACLGIAEAPGNAGLKDQVAALKWIRSNIAEFGGDPDNVTLFGESAGASSVSFHLLSKMSKGLFHKAIMQSGSSFCPWAMQHDPVYTASLLAKVMGHEAEGAEQVYKVLSSKSDSELILTRVPRAEGDVILSECLYVPCVERGAAGAAGAEPFLTELPCNIYESGDYNQVPVMIGMNSDEGYLFAAMENETTLAKIDLEKSLPKDLRFPSAAARARVAAEVDALYFKNETSRGVLFDLAKFLGEAFFANAVLEETEHLVRTNRAPVYSYVFRYAGYRNLAKLASGAPFSSAPGAAHADDLFYLFSQGGVPSLFEHDMIDRMTTLWTNFAKYGDPTPAATKLLPFKWYPANGTDPQSLVLDRLVSTAPLRHTDTLRFWRSVYTKYRRKS